MANASAEIIEKIASPNDRANNGAVGSSNGRNRPSNALGAPDGKFPSLGRTAADGSNPGPAVFDVGRRSIRTFLGRDFAKLAELLERFDVIAG
ncbi:MAG: hypothetical protein NC924_09065, partial [Candidatus Omnitrophica bacterium]|nr:hypothetical protein [Candidatus Omnitrophota bacterium]